MSRHPPRHGVDGVLDVAAPLPEHVREIADDVLRLRDECIEKRLSKSRPGLGVVRSRTTLVNAAGVEALVMDASYLVRCREA